ncbi:MAG: calcium/proton exchanger [Terriglobales bacterium]
MPEKPRIPNWREKFPLKTGYGWLDLLLLAVPVAIVLQYVLHASPLLLFAVAAIGIIPLAGAMGEATDELGQHLGERAGGLLNATMGNATELIISFFALRAGHVEIVKASISGSIIGNVLLVLGMSALVGGIGREHQTFSRRYASINGTMLFIAVVALVTPAVFDVAVYGQLRESGPRLEQLSLWTCLVLVVVYVLSIVFTFGGPQKAASTPAKKPSGSARSALVGLIVATVLVAIMSEILVGQIEAAKRALGMSDLFLGVIIIAVIGNAAEHATAIVMARRDRMELAVSIAVGSSSQIALLVAPILVFAAWLMGKPMSLVFSPLETAGIALAVLTAQMISSDGETTWFEGVQLIAVYVILAVAFYFVPGS